MCDLFRLRHVRWIGSPRRLNQNLGAWQLERSRTTGAYDGPARSFGLVFSVYRNVVRVRVKNLSFFSFFFREQKEGGRGGGEEEEEVYVVTTSSSFFFASRRQRRDANGTRGFAHRAAQLPEHDDDPQIKHQTVCLTTTRRRKTLSTSSSYFLDFTFYIFDTTTVKNNVFDQTSTKDDDVKIKLLFFSLIILPLLSAGTRARRKLLHHRLNLRDRFHRV